MNEQNKKITTKCHYFLKMLGILGIFFTNELECERGKQDFSNKVIVLKATNGLIFQYKNARKTSFNKYYTIGLFQVLQR